MCAVVGSTRSLRSLRIARCIPCQTHRKWTEPIGPLKCQGRTCRTMWIWWKTIWISYTIPTKGIPKLMFHQICQYGINRLPKQNGYDSDSCRCQDLMGLNPKPRTKETPQSFHGGNLRGLTAYPWCCHSFANVADIPTVCITQESKNSIFIVAIEWRRGSSLHLAFYPVPTKPLEPKGVRVDYVHLPKATAKARIMHAQKN